MFLFKLSTFRMFASMNLIIPGLYLGDIEAAEDLEMLREKNISHILIAAGFPLCKYYPEVLNRYNKHSHYILFTLSYFY